MSTGAATCRVTGVLTSTLVASVNTGGGGVPSRSGPNTNTASRTSAGTASAVSLSQYWKACTKVIERMPPKVTLAVTTRPTATTPTHSGAVVSTVSARPAACSCGSR